MKTKLILIAAVLAVAVGFLVVNHFVIHADVRSVGKMRFLRDRIYQRIREVRYKNIAQRNFEKFKRGIPVEGYKDIYVDPNEYYYTTYEYQDETIVD